MEFIQEYETYILLALAWLISPPWKLFSMVWVKVKKALASLKARHAPHVLMTLELDGGLVMPVSKSEAKKASLPIIKIDGLKSADAIIGSQLDWHTFPGLWRKQLEIDKSVLCVRWENLKPYLVGK